MCEGLDERSLKLEARVTTRRILTYSRRTRWAAIATFVVLKYLLASYHDKQYNGQQFTPQVYESANKYIRYELKFR